MKFTFLCIIAFLSLTIAGAQQLVINEFSQGNSGVREYIELVVAGDRTCAGDSCMDIRGWIIDDNNGWYGAGGGQGIATGHMRFSNDANWSCVPYGAIILLYNSGDVNPSITLPPDPTDANNDNIYVVPSTSAFLESTTTTPVSPSATGYVYPVMTYSPGGNWAAIGLANGGDAVVITAAGNLAAAHHSIAYGSVAAGTAATIYKAQSGTANVYSLSDDQYTLAASYIVGTAPANETPGAPNTAANAAWITGMLTNTSGTVDTNIAACINPGGSYNFNGTALTAPGMYHDTIPSTTACDSIIHLNLSLIIPVTASNVINGCNSVVFNGITYTSSAIVADTLNSSMGCDSIYRHTLINIQNLIPQLEQDTLTGCQSIVYKGIPYINSQEITDTLRSGTGCDSIYRKVYLNILQTPEIVISPSDTSICRGSTITLSAICDYPVQWIGQPQGNSITITPDVTATYSVQASNELNCSGIAHTTVHVEDFDLTMDYTPRPAESGQEVTLNTAANMNYSILQWTPSDMFSLQNATSQSIRALKPFTAMAIGQSDKGCLDTARIYVDVLPAPSIFLPTAFTPNGDGSNDYFGPRFLRDHKLKDFSIYNRWGQRVYSAATVQQLDKGWDGSYNGQGCALGTYYYILSAENARGEDVLLKGDILLVR